ANRARGFALEIAAVTDVLPAGRIHLEAQGDIEQGADLAFHDAVALGRRVNAGQDTKQRALAGAAVTDDAEAFAGFEVQIDVAQCLDPGQRIDRLAEHAADEKLLEADPAGFPELESDADIVELDMRHGDRSLYFDP